MKHLIFPLFLLFTVSLSAQVGIGTAMPDPSALLDMSSTEQGLLAPRMTTLERNAINAPANGLLVYDTTENIFYFFQDDSWEPIDATKMRTNYKLVQSIADLSDELAAGNGSKYVLNTNFLYEINGTIIFDFPIELNGAYIEGVDSSSDRLLNNSSGSLFEGSTGGGMRNLTLVGNGKQLFDITGTSTDLLLINNTIIAGASAVGSLNSIGTVFFSITQYVGNGTGWNITDVNNFFVSNIFWTTTNQGTFMSLNGTFANLQMNGGRVETNTNEFGLDVSSNPIIINDATLSQLSFVGDGTLVDRYTTGSFTGFNFTKDWNVNCSGIPTETDQVASGNFYYSGNLSSGFTQQIINGNPVEVQGNGTFVSTNLFRFEAIGGSNELVYQGKKTRQVQVSVSLSIRVRGGSGSFYAFAIAKNGDIVNETNSTVNIFNDTQIQNVALNGILTVSPGDRIQVFTDRFGTSSATHNLDIFSENLSVR